MARVKVSLSFEPESKEPQVFERVIEVGDIREPGGKEFVALHLFSEMVMEPSVHRYFLALPSVDDFLRPVKQTFRSEDLFSGIYEDRINTREMWMEIGNTLLRAKHLLALSRAYHDQERAHSQSGSSEGENLAWYFHLDKMKHFDLAIVLVGKVSDLTARLVFERLGASLIPNLDRNDPDWERSVTWSGIRGGLEDRARNPCLASLEDSEYKKLQEIFADFLRTDHGTKLWGYRKEFTHRITPSVDRPELYTHLQCREKIPITDTAGQRKGWTKNIGTRPTRAKYTFENLYEDAANTLRHYVSMLERLKAISPFGLEAGNAASSAA